MTRIALVTSSYLPHLGGVEEHVYHLAAELARRGHDVTVWSADRHARPTGPVGAAPVRYLRTPLPNRSPGGVLRWAVQLPVAVGQWWRAARADRPEVIDIQCFGANGPYATAVARLLGIPLVYSNHGETFMDAHGAFDASALMRRSLRRALASAAIVTSCSEFAAEDLRRFGDVDPVRVVANGIDLDAAASVPPVALPRTYIAAVGRLVANKGMDRLLLAFAAAAASPALAGVDLVIAGDGPEQDRLAGMARDLGVAERTHLIGPLGRTQVRALLDGALAHVVPSLVEAFGIVVLEGWRSGVPVVVTNRGGPAEFVTDGVDGLLVDPDDTTRLAEALIALATDPGLRARLGNAGRTTASRFSWATVADAYEQAFSRALDPSRSDASRRRA